MVAIADLKPKPNSPWKNSIPINIEFTIVIFQLFSINLYNMKKIIIIILLAIVSTGIMGFAITKKGTNSLMTKTSEIINPLPSSDKMEVINLVNEEQWN